MLFLVVDSDHVRRARLSFFEGRKNGSEADGPVVPSSSELEPAPSQTINITIREYIVQYVVIEFNIGEHMAYLFSI